MSSWSAFEHSAVSSPEFSTVTLTGLGIIIRLAAKLTAGNRSQDNAFGVRAFSLVKDCSPKNGRAHPPFGVLELRKKCEGQLIISDPTGLHFTANASLLSTSPSSRNQKLQLADMKQEQMQPWIRPKMALCTSPKLMAKTVLIRPAQYFYALPSH